MTLMKFIALGLPTLVLGSSSLFGSMPLSDPMSDVCVVWTVVEQELHISTCFLSSTIATIDGYTTSVAGPTCIDTTVTESKTINAPTEAPNTAPVDVTVYETFTTDVYTTVCPSATTFVYQDKTYTVTEPGGTTVTITDCPCRYSRPVVTQTPDQVQYTTITTDILTTLCPSSMTFTYGSKTYTVTESTVITITDCPCTYSRTIDSSEYTASSPAATITPSIPFNSPTITSSPETSSSLAAKPSSTALDPGSPLSSVSMPQSLPPPTPSSLIESTTSPTPIIVLSTTAVKLASSSISVEVSQTSSSQVVIPSHPSSTLPDVQIPSISITINPLTSTKQASISTTTLTSTISAISTPKPIAIATSISSISSSLTSVSATTSTNPFLPTSLNGTCGAAVNLDCNNSGFGNCCGADNSCGHNADHCGIGCQPLYGYCTLISNDGTCGNGVTCLGSVFGTCCSQYFNCGDGPDFCGTGCQPDFGLCINATSTTTYAPASSTEALIIPSPSTSGGCQSPTQFAPGSIPDSIGNATLASIPGPAVYNNSDVIYSFGFLDNNIGSLAYASTNPKGAATDEMAYYQVSSLIDPPTIGCATFGYIYHINSGFCLTANKTSDAYPDYEGASLMLEPCRACNNTPPVDQLFCSDEYTIGIYDPDQCLLFYGDTILPNSFYGPTYGSGPPTESTVLLDGGDCIFLQFPMP